MTTARRKFLLTILSSVFIIFLTANGAHACFFKSSCAGELIFTSYESNTPIRKNFGGLSDGASLRAQRLFIKKLTPTLGETIGYKAALTNPAMQTRFNSNSPVLGTILEKMLYENNSTLTPAFGARPMLEADIIVRVGDEGINNSKISEDVLSHLDAIIPFVELPDLYFAPGIKLDSGDITAINAGARSGVTGDMIPLGVDSKITAESLGSFIVEIYDGDGKLLQSGSAASIMGHPLNAVLWIKNEVRRRGGKLKKGDLLSLGSLTNFIVPMPGLKIKAVYKGLANGKDYEVLVNFSDK